MSIYKQVASNGRGVGLHVAIVEVALGKRLRPGAQVHHVDGNRTNNANSNLVVCQDNAYHKLLHIRGEVVRAGGDPNTQKFCRKCGTVKAFSEFNRANRKSVLGLTSSCRACCKGAFALWWNNGGAAKHLARRRQRRVAA